MHSTTKDKLRTQPDEALAWGVHLDISGRATFSLWAPAQPSIDLKLGDRVFEMARAGDGFFLLEVDDVSAGSEYAFVLADGEVIADPASRAQKGGLMGPSLVVDQFSYQWHDDTWRGRPWEETILYELHVGTFTPEGTFRAAAEKLPYLAGLGITMIELMPLAQFGGEHGWGYDGVLLYAPHAAYGSPDDLKHLVDTAHRHRISVVVDIVLNHFGPQGNYLPVLAQDFFHRERLTPWGAAIAYDNPAARRYIVEAALHWLGEFRLDGLRFDAIDEIKDISDEHVLEEIALRARKLFRDRHIHLTTEDARNIISLHPRDAAGQAPLFTAEWNDDFHNAFHVVATGETHSYYGDFAASPEAFLARAMTEGFSYQGEVSPQTGKPRGETSAGQPTVAFVDFIQNHDQAGNRARGERLIALAGEARTKVALAVLLMSPHIPLLFMGEEYGETNPFLFFTDFDEVLGAAVFAGRKREFAGHAGHDEDDVPDPNAISTFNVSKLDWEKLGTPQGRQWLDFTRELIDIRMKRIVPLLDARRSQCGRTLAVSGGFVAVEWELRAARLSIAFNVGTEARTFRDNEGQMIFAWPPIDDANPGELAPNSVVVRISPVGDKA